MNIEDLKPGDRILILGQRFPDDECEVVEPCDNLFSRFHNPETLEILVRRVQKPEVFILDHETKFNKIEGLP